MSDRHLQLFDPEIESILDGDREIPEPPMGARDRVRSRVLLSIGIGAASVAGAASSVAAATRPSPEPIAPPAAAPSPVAPAAGLARTPVLRLAFTCLAGALVGGGAIYMVMRDRPAPTPIVVPAPVANPTLVDPTAAPSAAPVIAPAVADAVEPASTAPTVEVTPPSKAARPHRPHVANHSAGAATVLAVEPSGLEAERRLLEQARASLALRDTAGALTSLDHHASRFPRGQLIEERESLRVRVLVAAGRDAEARALGEAFRRRFPGSVYLPAVDATLQSIH